MCDLNNEQIILLNNVIYIDMDADEGDTLGDVVFKLLECGKLKCLFKNNESCLVVTTYEEWEKILKNILNDKILSILKIRNILRCENGGIKAAAFVNDRNEAVVVFKGTSNIKEWDDNGKGAYEYDTEEQVEALNYINSLEYSEIAVTGHSKGGNKAQYTAILSERVSECISINGQGFSNEFINKYSREIDQNKYKIKAINAKNDYVNCLFNSICGDCTYIDTEIQKNPLFYHKANILLDGDGRLNPECSRSNVAKIINDFSTALISELPRDVRELTVDGVIGAVEAVLCGEEVKEKFIKIAGGIIIMLIFSEYYFMKKQFFSVYETVKALTIPLLFWNDLIKAESENSNHIMQRSIKSIYIIQNSIIRKLKGFDIINEKEALEYKLADIIGKATEKLIEQLNSKVIMSQQ